MSAILTLALAKGSARDFVVQAANPDGTPATNVFLGSDSLVTTVWSGDGTAVLLSPTTAWVSAPAGTFQVSFNNADTASLSPSVYRIQTTATRGGRSGVLLDGRLELTSAPGTSALTDLVTQDVLTAGLADRDLSDAQRLLLPQLTRAASRLIRKHCNRWFNRRPSADGTLAAYDGLYTLDWPSRTVLLRQFPCNGLVRVRSDPTQVLTVTNTDSTTNQQATAALATTGVEDVDDVPPAVTGLTLWRMASGTPWAATLAFATYKTLSALVTAINALGGGWSASLADPSYANWPTADFRAGVGPQPALGIDAGAGFPIHVQDVPARVDLATGMVVLDQAAADPWSSPRFGPPLDTGLGDLQVQGGFQGLRIVYDAGWDTVPEDVQQACVETVQDLLNLLALDQRVRSEDDGAYRYALAEATHFALTPSVRGKLAYYRSIRA